MIVGKGEKSPKLACKEVRNMVNVQGDGKQRKRNKEKKRRIIEGRSGIDSKGIR